MFKVEIRTTCKICGNKLGYRQRTFCSDKCRNKSYSIKAVDGYESCRQYREEFGLEVKRGIVPDWYRKLKGDTALENETFKNLQAGAAFRFKPGDPRAGKYERSQITINRLKLNRFKSLVSLKK